MPKAVLCHFCQEECDGYLETLLDDYSAKVCPECAVAAGKGPRSREAGTINISALLVSSSVMGLVFFGFYCLGYSAVMYCHLLSH
jgi:hypothetical protein